MRSEAVAELNRAAGEGKKPEPGQGPGGTYVLGGFRGAALPQPSAGAEAVGGSDVLRLPCARIIPSESQGAAQHRAPTALRAPRPSMLVPGQLPPSSGAPLQTTSEALRLTATGTGGASVAAERKKRLPPAAVRRGSAMWPGEI